jgi:hypothetical protein
MKVMKTRSLVAPFVVVVAVAAAACGGTAISNPPPVNQEGGVDAGADGATDGSTDAGTDLFPADTTKVVVTDKGGFGPGVQDGSTCSPADSTYTLLLPSRELSWKICESTGVGGGTYAFRTGQKTIAEADFTALSDALHALRRQTKTQCGADKPSETIVFTTPSGDVTYLDDFYFCDATDTKAYVTGLDAVLQELNLLAK